MFLLGSVPGGSKQRVTGNDMTSPSGPLPTAAALPRAPGELLRPRLHALLTDACSDSSLVALIAGAGFGKTTALAAWAREMGHNADVIWIDAGDADAGPGGLFEAVWSALEIADLDVDPSAPSPPRVGGPDARSLARMFSERPRELILVLDDLHEVRSRRTFSVLDQLIRLLPSNTTLVIASRWEPLLHLNQLRTEGGMHELGPTSLAMTPEEIRLVFEADGIPSAEQRLAHLVEVTQGWPVAVRLARSAVASGGSLDDVLGGDGSVGRIVGRYLADEVFHRLPAEWRDVLACISILDQVHVGLARELSDNDRAPTILEEVAARTGLFTQLPTTPGWLRPHRLAQAYLRTTLEADGPQRVADLHDRAARWFIERGDLSSAIPHAVRSRNDGTIRATMEGTGLAALLCSDEHSIRCARAIAAATPDVWPNGRPLVLAIAVLASAQPPAALALLQTVDPTTLGSKEERRLWAVARCKVLRNQARYADARAALDTASWQGAQPKEIVLRDSEFALAAVSDESFEQLTRHAESALMLARSVGADRPVVHLQVALSVLALARGEPREAKTHAHQALELGRRFGPELELELAESRMVCTIAAIDLGEAVDHERSCHGSQPWSEPGAPVHLLLAGTITELHQQWRAGEPSRPLLDQLDRAFGSVDLSAVHPGVLFAAAYLELRLAEASQDLPRVQQAVARMSTDIAEAQVLRAEEQRVRRAYRKGRDELRPVIAGEIPPMWGSTRLLALALDGVLAHLDGGSDTESLQDAVQMAQRTGRRGPFIDLGAPMFETLVARRMALPSHDGFVEELIEELRQHEPPRLPEPLTQAEIRVLGHLDSMATLQEIAAGLNLSRNTVKTHAAAIYRKLEASARRDAVARARMLGLL
jgi:LuxR family transcriptional regulator, maltose regulon positive regulatory protein